MTITYRTAGPWGPGVGANLTPGQVDYNFYDVVQRVQYLELHPQLPVQITSFSATGNQLYIYMSDGSVNGPLTLPTVRWFFRGNWAPGTSYSLDDVIIGPDNSTYLVMTPHTSDPAFSPDANDGQGHKYYSTLMKSPAISIPAGGGRGTVLTKASTNSYDMTWAQPGVLEGGDEGTVLQKNSAQDGDAGWNFLWLEEMENVQINFPLEDGDYLQYSNNTGMWINKPRPMLNVLFSTSWAPTVGDEGSFMVLLNGNTNTTITIPPDSTEDFPTGAELHIHADGPGLVTIVGGSNVQLLYHASFTNVLLGKYATATVKKTGYNQWRLFGLLKAAS